MTLKAIDGGANKHVTFPIREPGTIHLNNSRAELYNVAIERGEGKRAANGAFAVTTGQHTGRSAKDKYVVRDASTEDTIWWDNSAAMTPEQFATLKEDFLAHANGRELFVQDLFAGADPVHRLNSRIYCEFAWHALFIQHLMIEPTAEDRDNFDIGFTIVDLPSFKADPARHGTRTETVIALDLANKLVLIGGTEYAGEMKKSVFSYLNYILPEKNIMPMHCSVNEDAEGNSAVFFGLSGTGKTTLSADPKRPLVGDDEHGWAPNGVFNFEGGCYAKAIRLSEEAEPEIYGAINREHAVMENVVLNDAGEPDFDDGSLTENTRGAYPLDFIKGASETGMSGQPLNIVMLTADAFGVLPPIAKLTPAQAMYHFLSGYTAKVAGTEKGVTEPTATFSTCFGAPFMPRHPSVYGNLLRDLIAEHKVDCWLVNTGWTGGKYGVGNRMPIKATRRLLDAALGGSLKSVPMRVDPIFGFEVPEQVEGLEDQSILTPRETWADKAEYDQGAAKLVEIFVENFKKFESHVAADVKAAAPQIQDAAE